MDSLQSIISDIRVFLYGGIRTLPLTIAGTMIILGLFTANYAMIFFLLGYLILAPLLAAGLNLGSAFLLEMFKITMFTVKAADVCNIVVPYMTMKNMEESKNQIIVISMWSAMMSFFFGYIIGNAVELFTFESAETDDSDHKQSNRKFQAMIAFFSIVVVTVGIMGYRMYTGCESVWATVLTSLLFGAGGYGWYLFLGAVGQNRLSDLFGIANRLLSPSAIENAPVACVPV